MPKPPALCVVCGSVLSKRSYTRCAEHRATHRKRTTLRVSAPPTPLETPCRVWQGITDRNGYGAYRGMRLHRWVVEQADGPIPEGMIVMHLCDNPPCFRYDHLRVATTAENNADRAAKGRSNRSTYPSWMHKSGEEHTQAKLTAKQVQEIRSRLRNGEKGYMLAAEFGVSKPTVSLIKNRHIWADVPDA